MPAVSQMHRVSIFASIPIVSLKAQWSFSILRQIRSLFYVDLVEYKGFDSLFLFWNHGPIFLEFIVLT